MVYDRFGDLVQGFSMLQRPAVDRLSQFLLNEFLMTSHALMKSNVRKREKQTSASFAQI